MTWEQAIEIATENGRSGFVVLAHPRWYNSIHKQEWCWHAMRKGTDVERAFRSTR